jgi:hypothetical protein
MGAPDPVEQGSGGDAPEQQPPVGRTGSSMSLGGGSAGGLGESPASESYAWLAEQVGRGAARRAGGGRGGGGRTPAAGRQTRDDRGGLAAAGGRARERRRAPSPPTRKRPCPRPSWRLWASACAASRWTETTAAARTRPRTRRARAGGTSNARPARAPQACPDRQPSAATRVCFTNRRLPGFYPSQAAAWRDPSGGVLAGVFEACEAGEPGQLPALLEQLRAEGWSVDTPGPDGDTPL